MSLKFKISILHIAISFMTLFFIYMVYDSYVLSQKKEIEKQLTRILNLNQEHMKNSLTSINMTLEQNKDLTKKIHLNLHEKIKNIKNPNLQLIKNETSQSFDLENKKIDIEIFLIEKNKYKIIDSTEAKNFGLELINKKKAKDTLDTLKNINQFNRSDEISVDFLDYELKNYSYSKLDENLYLGLGIIYKEVINQRKDFNEMREIANSNIDLFCVMKDVDNNLFYESLVAHKKPFNKTSEYDANEKKFPINKPSVDPIINTSKTWEQQTLEYKDLLHVYVPLLKEKNPMVEIPGDIILKVVLDTSQERIFFQSIIFKLILFIFIHFILIFIIFYFTSKYQTIQKKLLKENNKHQQLVNYNKTFISNMVHQIRTPLAIILSNISLIEMIQSNGISKYTKQIVASINSLSNSYENLSYYISFKSLVYSKRNIKITEFLKERVAFFDVIAQANGKNILVNVQNDLNVYFNDIELERLIDNNISNSIKNADFNSNIIITFYSREKEIFLEFKSYSKNKENENLFEKEEDVLIKDTSNVSLGIYVVKQICLKNKIKYYFEKKNNYFTFQYIWK